MCIYTRFRSHCSEIPCLAFSSFLPISLLPSRCLERHNESERALATEDPGVSTPQSGGGATGHGAIPVPPSTA
jgi:hypothetical protein